MNRNRHGAVARLGAGISRRASLLTLASAAAVTIAPSQGAEAAKANKRCRRKCARQRVQCRNVISEVCAGAVNPDLCLAEFLPSCDPLAACNAEETVRRLFFLQ